MPKAGQVRDNIRKRLQCQTDSLSCMDGNNMYMVAAIDDQEVPGFLCCGLAWGIVIMSETSIGTAVVQNRHAGAVHCNYAIDF